MGLWDWLAGGIVISGIGIAVGLIALAVAILWTFAVTLLGAFIGWVIDHTFLNDWISYGFKALLGIDTSGKHSGIGAALAFVSSFFKTYSFTRKRED
jgi:4-hydroxybenzoate polyprenyltransferase